MADKVSFGNGQPYRTPERWPFSQLKPGHFFECTDLSQHTAIRTAASRARKRLKRRFSVRKVTLTENRVRRQVIRVYLEP
jgi:hypothetical protein